MVNVNEKQPLTPSQSIRDCQAVIVALASGRFVIVHAAGQPRIRSTEMLCRPVKELTAGERVYHRGNTDVVLAVAPY